MQPPVVRCSNHISSPHFSTMVSHTSCDSREDFSYCIEGWIRDQQKQTEPESDTKSRRASARHKMSDQPLTPQLSERPSSPSKRQRTSEAGSGSQWVERLSSVGLDSALPTFTEPTSSGTSASRAPSPTKSVRNRRIQLDYTSPAIYFGPPKNSHDSEEESSDNDSRSGSAERAAPTLQLLSLEHTIIASNIEGQHGIPPDISALVQRLSEETADPVLPPDITLQISRISPTESFRKPLPDTNPSSKSSRKHLRHISRLFEMARELYAGSYDESAWYPLIRDILIDPPHATSATPFVKHEEAHTRQVCTELLPQQKDSRVPTVRVDHLLQFNPSHKQISPLYRALRKALVYAASADTITSEADCLESTDYIRGRIPTKRQHLRISPQRITIGRTKNIVWASITDVPTMKISDLLELVPITRTTYSARWGPTAVRRLSRCPRTCSCISGILYNLQATASRSAEE